MKKWNEFGVNREADEATFAELISLRAAVHRFEAAFREQEKSQSVATLQDIAQTLKSIDKKMGTEMPKNTPEA